MRFPRPHPPRSSTGRPAVLLAALLAALGAGGACAPAPARPDVVLVVVDTLRADRLGAYGSGRPTSPVIDRLAREGVLVEDVVAQSSWTRPSMVSLFSGRYVTAYRDVPVEDAEALAEAFQRAGYATVGAIANVLLSERFGFARGFDRYDERRREGAEEFGELGRDAQRLVEDALALLDERLAAGEGEPFFLYLHFMDPHHPYEERAELAAELPLEGARPLDARARETYLEVAGDLRVDDEQLARDLAEIDAMRGRYDREVRAVDDALGRLLEGLERRGRLSGTIVALVSDHGEVLFEHPTPRERWGPVRELGQAGPLRVLQGAHGLLLTRSLVHTPFVLWGADLPRGLRLPGPAQNVDLFPTLLELCDLSPPEGLHGRSLVPWIRGERGDPTHEYVFAFVQQHRMVREVDTGWKLVLPNPPFSEHDHYRPRLHHLPSDPEERVDRFEHEPAVAARLAEALDRWQRTHPIKDSADRRPGRAELNALRALGYLEGDEEGLPGLGETR